MKRLIDMGDAELDERTERLRALAGALSPAQDSEIRAARVARAIDAAAEGRAVPATRLRLLASVAMLAVLLVTVVAAATAVGRYRGRPSLPPMPQPAPAAPAAALRAPADTLLPPPPAAAPAQPPAATVTPAPVAGSRAVSARVEVPPPAPSTALVPPPVKATPPARGEPAPIVDRPSIVERAPLPAAPAAARPASATKLPLDEDEPAESPLAEVAAHIADAGSPRRLPDAPATEAGGESRLLLRAVGALRRGDPAAAASFVEQYLRDHPDGACIEEAYALGIDAARRRDILTSTLAADYLRRFADGRYARFAERVLRRSSGSSAPPAPTPR